MVRLALIALLLLILVMPAATKNTKVSVVFLVQVCATFMCRLSVSIDNKGLTGVCRLCRCGKAS